MEADDETWIPAGRSSVRTEETLWTKGNLKFQVQEWSWCRRVVFRTLTHIAFDILIGVCLIFQLVLAARETDLLAQGRSTPQWIDVTNHFFLGVYSIEIILRAYAFRSQLLTESFWNAFDVSVVATDIVFSIGSAMPPITVIRIFRLFRLARALRAVNAFRELHQLLTLTAGAMRSLVSAFMLLFVLFTICSLAAVELLQPIVDDLVEETGHFEGCPRCARAFESVMQANLTWFQTIITGDGWGTYFCPIIERSPAAGAFLVVLTVLVSLGLMNILMSVIVSQAEANRREDEHVMVREKHHAYEKAKKKLMKYCEALDTDKSGSLSLFDLQRGIHTHKGFADALDALEIDPTDMHVLFEVLDEDGSGSISYEEFVVNLHKLKAADDSHTLLVFIRHYCEDIRSKVTKACQEEMARLDEIKTAVAETLKLELANHMKTEPSHCNESERCMSKAQSAEVGGCDEVMHADIWLSERKDQMLGVWSPLPSREKAPSWDSGTQTDDWCVGSCSGKLKEEHAGGNVGVLPKYQICSNSTQTDNTFTIVEPSVLPGNTSGDSFVAPVTRGSYSREQSTCVSCQQDLVQKTVEDAPAELVKADLQRKAKMQSAGPSQLNNVPNIAPVTPQKSAKPAWHVLQSSLLPFTHGSTRQPKDPGDDLWEWHSHNARTTI